MEITQNLAEEVESKVYLIRGKKVMLDFDLAALYQVPTKRLKEQVSRNEYRFPNDFTFPLTKQELANLRSQFVTSSLKWGGMRYLPTAFTEQGIAMLSSVLNSRRAIEVNIMIMRTFTRIKEVRVSGETIEKKIAERVIGIGGKDGA